jgi:hypothetical protein
LNLIALRCSLHSLLPLFSCEEKNKRYMLSQGHPEGFNIEACWRCEEKRLSHIETGAEKQCKNATELVSPTVL